MSLITDSQNLNETRFKNKFDPYQYLQMSSIKVTFRPMYFPFSVGTFDILEID